MLIEAFDSMLISGGVILLQSWVLRRIYKNLNHLRIVLIKLVEEVIQLRKKSKELIKMGLVAELSEGLTLVQAQRFQRLASIVEFTGPEFSDKLETSVRRYQRF